MAVWPDLTEYHEAVQYPARAFQDPTLKGSKLELDRFGMPKPSTGANAVVYRATDAQGGLWAIRCFLRPITDHAERYAAISRHLQATKSEYACGFEFLPEGVKVRGKWYPLVKMAWADGQLLHTYIQGKLKDPESIAALREKWRRMIRLLEQAKIAHGDLQQGNILVRNNNLLLVDYDGMWVPQLVGKLGTEIGHRAFQHPLRSQNEYGPYIDRFSALVIYLSLVALEKKPELWDLFHNGDNLIFTQNDFREGVTPLWKELLSVNSAQTSHMMSAVIKALTLPVDKCPTLDDVLRAAPLPLPSWMK